MELKQLILEILADKQAHKSKEFHHNSSLVRKAVRELRLKGYPIKGTNKGYVLVPIGEIEKELRTYRNRALKILEVYNRLKRLQKKYYENRYIYGIINFGGGNND